MNPGGNVGKKGNWIGKALLALVVFGLAFFAGFTHWDFAPASGSAYGYIYYQEKSGVFQLETVCWKDTPYVQNCEWFDPLEKKYGPGKYYIQYDCGIFAWAWEKPGVCDIINATRVEE